MKKLLFFLCLAYSTVSAYSQTPSIPNGNFEQWTSETFDYPQYYPFTTNPQNFFQYNLPSNVTKTTDAYHGMYAVQLTTNANSTDTAVASFVNANTNTGQPSTFKGGIAYDQQPTGIRGYFKYNVATADSATILVGFRKAGVNIGTYLSLIGGVHTTYSLFNFTFNPALTVTPDSVIFGAITGKLVNGQPHGIAGSTLLLDSISFTGVSSQPALFNGDFESWESQTFNSPNNWYVQNGGDSGAGLNRTTDAKAGLYAIELKTFLGNNYNNNLTAQPARISTGYLPNNCNSNCQEMGGFPFSNQIDTLAFWYKYAPSGNDSAQIILNFKKNGTIFWQKTNPLLAASTYQYVEIPFNIPGQTPDSVIVDIQSSLWQDTLLTSIGSDLKIDEVHFKSQPLNVGIFNYKNENSINIFPNPAKDKILVESLGFRIQTLEIYNVLGENVYTTTNLKQQVLNEIDLSAFLKGIYFVKIYNDAKIYIRKIVVQ